MVFVLLCVLYTSFLHSVFCTWCVLSTKCFLCMYSNREMFSCVQMEIGNAELQKHLGASQRSQKSLTMEVRPATIVHQLHDLSKCMSSDSSCKLYSRLNNIIDINKDNIATHISLLLFEYSLTLSDLYRISPNTLEFIVGDPSNG